MRVRFCGFLVDIGRGFGIGVIEANGIVAGLVYEEASDCDVAVCARVENAARRVSEDCTPQHVPVTKDVQRWKETPFAHLVMFSHVCFASMSSVKSIHMIINPVSSVTM